MKRVVIVKIRKRYHNKKTRIISSILSIAVVLMLIFSGPVRAITLGIDIGDKEVTSGEVVEITAKVDLHSNDIVPADLNFTINIQDESSTYTCVFDIEGNNLTDCLDFDITTPGHNLVYYENGSLYAYGYGYGETNYNTEGTSFDYGYGYGYSYGYGYDDYSASLKEDAEITFTIKWTTPEVEEKTDYSVSLEAKMNGGGNEFTYATLLDNQGSFTVSPEEKEDEGGSGYTPVGPGEKTEYEKRVEGLTEGLTLQIKNRVKNTCNQMKGIIENATESSLTTNTSQFQEQMRYLGLENVEAVMTNIMEEKQFMPSGLSKETREKFKDKVFADIANVVRNVKITTFINGDGTSISLIDISYTIDQGDFAIEIPKTVAATADKIQGSFDVLVNDPVLLFNNVRTVEFSVEAETNDLEEINEDIDEISISKVEERQEGTTPPEEEEGEEEEGTPPPEEEDGDEDDVPVEEDKGINWVLWTIIIILLSGAILWVLLRRNK